MKKALLITNFFLIILLTACSVQEKVSPDIFVERLSEESDAFVFDKDNSFIQNGSYIFFAKYENILEIVLKAETDTQGNVKKISLACTQTDKADKFISCIKSVIETYSPEDDSNEIILSLFKNKQPDDKNRYYETQWHSYSAVLSENGFFFSVKNKKLIEESSVEFSLKENDIIEY